MIYHWVHTADPVGFIMISPVIWSRDLLCLASGFGCVPGTLVLRGVGHHNLRKTEPLHSVVPRCFVDTCCEWFTTMAFRWTTLQSRQWSWPLNGLPVALGICPDYWMWCLRNGFQSAGIYSCTCIAVNPNTQGVCVCVCVLVCVCVCDSKPAVKVYCTWWWNDDNSLVFSEETVKFSADFNSFRRKFEKFDDSKRIVCNQMVATREDPAPLCSRAIRRLVDNFATRSDT